MGIEFWIMWISGILFTLMIFLPFLGFDIDDVLDTDVWGEWFSIKAFLGSVFQYTITRMVFSESIPTASFALSFGVSFVLSVCMYGITIVLFMFLHRLRETGTVESYEYVGRIGIVSVRIKKNNSGRVTFLSPSGDQSTLRCVSDGNKEIKRGRQVMGISLGGDGKLRVSEVSDAEMSEIFN